MPKVNLLLVGMIAVFLFLTNFANADIGPKPMVHIGVYKNGVPVSEQFQARLLACYNQSINNSQDSLYLKGTSSALLAIDQPDPQRNCSWQFDQFAWSYCDNSTSSSFNQLVGGCADNAVFDYFVPDEFELAVYVPSENRVYISNPMTRPPLVLNSYFKVDLANSGMTYLSDITPPYVPENGGFLLAVAVTLFVELFVGLIWLHHKKVRLKKAFVTILVANLISVPIVWFGFAQLQVPYEMAIFLGEIFAVVFEATMYFIFLKEVFRKFLSALVFSFVLNAASFFIGFIIGVLIGLFV